MSMCGRTHEQEELHACLVCPGGLFVSTKIACKSGLISLKNGLHWNLEGQVRRGVREAVGQIGIMVILALIAILVWLLSFLARHVREDDDNDT